MSPFPEWEIDRSTDTCGFKVKSGAAGVEKGASIPVSGETG